MTESIANYNDRFAKVDDRFARVEGTQRLHSWMLTYVAALLTALAWRIFS